MLLSRTLAMFVLMAAAGDTGGSGGSADEVEVELQGGVKAKLPKAQADAYIAARARDKQERDELAKRAGAAQAEREDAERKRLAAEQESAAIKAAKDGEVGKAKDILTRESNEKLAKIGRMAVSDHVRAAASRVLPGLDSMDLDDLVALTTSRCRFNTDTLAVEFLDDAGQPAKDTDGKMLGADAFVQDFTKSRKRFQNLQVPPGSGSIGSAKQPVVAGKITRAEYDAQVAAGNRATIQAIHDGKLTVAD